MTAGGASAATDHEPADTGDTVAAIARAAESGGIRIGLAESLTSGQLATTIGAGENAQDWFAGAVVAYQSRTKEDLLSVAPGIDPCSAECAVQLADGVRRLLGADVAVSTTGVGGPEPQDGHAPGTVYIGWAAPGGSGSARHRFAGNPESMLAQTVEAAAALLLERLGAIGEKSG